MNVSKRFFLLVVLVLFLPICSVNAAKENNVKVEDKLYYYTDITNSKYGSFYGLSKNDSNANKYTRYKYMGEGEGKNPAYCVQSEDLAPKNGDTYIEVDINEAIEKGTWSEENVWVTGFIIRLIDKDYSGNEEYVMTYAALNSYLTGTLGGKNFAAYNPTVDNYIKKAKDQYKKYFTTTLPNFKVNANNKVLTRNENGKNITYMGSFKLTDLTDSFGESHIVYDSTDKISYTIKPSSNKVQLCEEKTCKNPKVSLKYTGVSNDMEFFIKATNVTEADDITVTITATNESYYNMGRLWKPKSGNSQILLGLGYDKEGGTGHITRSRVKKVNFVLPDLDPVKKTIILKKFDSATGALLGGANLKLELSGINKTCETKGGVSCKIEVIENDINEITYSVTEITSPLGYKKGEALKNAKWSAVANTEICYIVNSNGTTTKTELVDCDRNYKVAPVACKVNDSYVFENCKVEEDRTDLNCNEETGVCTSTLTGEVVDVIPTKVIGEEITNVCYFDNDDIVNIVDSSKCGSQYMKVTDSGNNLVVEYYNEKNKVVISKIAINGSEEVSGATLKICSNKPDASGNCNVVRNVLDGQCVNGNTNVDGYFNINTDVNCKNIDNETKEVDMQWVSGLTPKIWSGLKAGTYYIVETIAPKGYKPLTTAVEFKIDDDGVVTSKAYNKELDRIVIENSLTKFNVIKKDSKSGKVLSGAGLGICTTYKDEKGNYQMRVGESGFCVSANLIDGKVATWTSNNKVKSIEGLVPGTYYLVELNAPNGYDVAKSILFTLKSDGTIVDKDGKLFKENTLIMYDDEKVDNPKTSGIPSIIYVVIGGGILTLLMGLGYYLLVVKNGIEIIKDKFNKKKK